MTIRDEDDRDLDAFLHGEDALSALLRGTEQPEPPSALDARILAQARAALAEPAAAANDPAPVHVSAPWLRRARVPLGLAATVVFGLSLTLRWDGGQGEKPVAVLADSVPTAPAAAPAVEQQAPTPRQEAPAAVQDRPVAKTPAPPQVRAPAPQQKKEMPAQAAEPMTQAVPLPPPPPPPAPAPAAPAPVAAAPSAQAVEVTGNRIGRAPSPDAGTPAQQRLAVIADLLDRHLDDAARDAWLQFRREYPDYPVPPALQARIDALPAVR